jgi:hypothetical protein
LIRRRGVPFIFFFVLFLFELLGLSGNAEEKPELEHVFPAGAVRGTTNSITLFGKFEPWPPKIWCDGAGLAFDFPTNKGRLNITVSNDAPVSPCLIRVYNGAGASEPCIFVVSQGVESLEKEPNDHFSKGQLVAQLPVTINGRLEKGGDVDSYQLQVKAGDWIDARVDSYTLMGKVDPILRLVDEKGYQIAWNHDFATLDPRLIWRAPRDETVVLQLFGFVYPANSQIEFTGGPGGVYRLHLDKGATQPKDVIILNTEHEPNDGRTNAFESSLPMDLSGVINPAGDEDRFRVTLKKDTWIEARAESNQFGSPLDPWLKIEDSTGKEMTRDDDAENSRDARIEWRSPADGDYTLVVGSLTRHGSDEFRYRLRAKTLSPEYRATLAANSITVSAGATNSLKFNLKRLRGFTNEITASIKALPEGVILGAINIPPKDGEGSIELIAATNAPAFNAPLEVLLKDNAAQEQRPLAFELVSRTENNGVPGGYTTLLVESLPHIWLTVAPRK